MIIIIQYIPNFLGKQKTTHGMQHMQDLTILDIICYVDFVTLNNG